MPTIRDVAAAAGVSTATVSHVLHGRTDRMSAATRERVLAVVRDLRYRPTALETRQKAASTCNLAVLYEAMSRSPLTASDYFGRVLDGIIEAAASRGWSTTIAIEQFFSDGGSAIRRRYDGKCDGVILVAPSMNSEAVEGFRERGVPMVHCGSSRTMQGVSTVDIENEQSAYEATRYLIGLGHRRLAYFGGAKSQLSSTERSIGFERAVKEAGIGDSGYYVLFGTHGPTIEEEPVLARPSHSESGSRFEGWADQMVDLVVGGPKEVPTAVLCWNDDLGVTTLNALRKHGFRVPQDVSIVAYDDSALARECEPPLTVIRQPLQAIGKRCANILIDRVEDPKHPDENVRYTPELVIRESTGPAPKGAAKA